MHFCTSTSYRHFKIFLSIYFCKDIQFFLLIARTTEKYFATTYAYCDWVHGQLLLPKIYLFVFLLALNLRFDDKILNIKYFDNPSLILWPFCSWTFDLVSWQGKIIMKFHNYENKRWFNISKLNMPKAIKFTIQCFTFHRECVHWKKTIPQTHRLVFKQKQMTWVCTNTTNALLNFSNLIF